MSKRLPFWHRHRADHLVYIASTPPVTTARCRCGELVTWMSIVPDEWGQTYWSTVRRPWGKFSPRT